MVVVLLLHINRTGATYGGSHEAIAAPFHPRESQVSD
jgi:hypothetical protein